MASMRLHKSWVSISLKSRVMFVVLYSMLERRDDDLLDVLRRELEENERDRVLGQLSS